MDREASGWQDSRTLLGVPLLREGVPLGIIGMWREEARPFTDKQIELVNTFADQAVIAIENVRLLQQLQAKNRDLTEALEQQTATSEILRVIASSPTDLQPVFQTILDNAVRLCEAQNGAVFRFDGEVFRSVVSKNISPALHAYVQSTPIRPGRETQCVEWDLKKGPSIFWTCSLTPSALYPNLIERKGCGRISLCRCSKRII